MLAVMGHYHLHHAEGSGRIGLLYLNDIETPGKGFVFFNMLPVFFQRGGAYNGQFTTGRVRVLKDWLRPP